LKLSNSKPGCRVSALHHFVKQIPTMAFWHQAQSSKCFFQLPRVLTTRAFTRCQTQNILAHSIFSVVQFVILWGKFSFFEQATNFVCAWKLL
jgi:hypothetical protein